MNKPAQQRDKESRCLVETKWVYRGSVVQLKLETYRFDHRTKIAEMIHHPSTAVILPIDSEGRILLIQQWRRAVGSITLELPAGRLEKDEDPKDSARRELREETGLAAKAIQSLGGFYSAPGFCDEYLHLFLAEDLYSSPLPPDDDEMIDLFPVAVEEAKRMIAQNEIRDAKTIAGIFKYLLLKNP